MSAKRLHAVDAVQPVAAGPRYLIESVDNVLRLLLMISQQKQVRVPEASAALGRLCRLRVPRTSSMSCDQAVLVDHATDASVSSDKVLLKIDRFG